jgi:hypothetical protein
MSATTPTYTRDDDRIVHALLSPSAISPANSDAARRNYQLFVTSALGRLKGFRSVEEREANCGPFALSVVVFGVLSMLLAVVSVSTLPAPTMKASTAPRELLLWIDLSIGMVGTLVAYSSWASRWSSYSLSPVRRMTIAFVIFAAFSVLLVKASRLHDGAASISTSRHLISILQVGVSAAGVAVLLTNRTRLSRLASTIRDSASPL